MEFAELGDRDLTLRDIFDEIRALRGDVIELKELVMSQQSELDAVASTVQSAATTLEAAAAAIEAAQVPLDFTALNTAVTNLGTAISAVTALVPVPTPTAVQAFDPASDLPLYTYAGTEPAPGAPWTAVTDVTGPDDEVLFTNSGDAAGQSPQFTSVEWPAFTGALTTV